jgi:putative two-component system response regulator
MAGTHHEKWDGSGYPYGLIGENIPLMGRLMAIADVYDALTSDRPYKKSFSHEESVEIIRAGRGTHFDPQIVGVFLLHEQEFKEAEHKIRARQKGKDNNGGTRFDPGLIEAFLAGEGNFEKVKAE